MIDVYHRFSATTLLRSSESCAWSDVAAEHRLHPANVLPPMVHTHTEISIATRKDRTVIDRRSGGDRQQARSELGAIWLSPAGLHVDEAYNDTPIEILHLQLSNSRFERLSEVFGGAPVPATSVGYISGFRDDLIQQIGSQILSEMKCQTAAGRVLVDALAFSLTARLVQAYASTQGRAPQTASRPHGLDDGRIRRVLEFMHAHLEDDIGVQELAAAASLSPFHFSRMFRRTVGMPPHEYLSTLRLERSKTLLARSDLSLAQIALVTCFSTQANFTRAFRIATGTTPGEYRRRSR